MDGTVVMLYSNTYTLIWSWYSFAALTALALWFSSWFGVFLCLIHSAEHLWAWCWMRSPGSQSQFQFITKVLHEVGVRTWCRPVKFFHTRLKQQNALKLLIWCTWVPSCWNRKGSSTNSTNSWKHCILVLSLPSLEMTLRNIPIDIPLPPNLTDGTVQSQG